MTESNKQAEYIPPVPMRMFVEALVSEQVKGNVMDAERVSGVNRGRFYYYMKKPEFRAWYLKLCDERFSRLTALAYSTLEQEMRRGDSKVQAVKTYFEILGKIKNGADINITNVNNANYGEPTAEEEEFVRQQRETLGL